MEGLNSTVFETTDIGDFSIAKLSKPRKPGNTVILYEVEYSRP